MKNAKWIILLLVFLGLSTPLLAVTFDAQVVGVSDGDTLALLAANKKQVKAD